MITNPIIPIWVMGILSIVMIFIKKDKNKWTFIRRLVVVILLFLINMRIMIPSTKGQVATNNLDVLFVIDSTISMLAEDYNGNTKRMTAVKQDCKYIIDTLNGARFSIINFNNESQVVIPYTKDSDTAIEAINTISYVDELYAKGSSLNIPIDDMNYVLESSNKKEDRYSIVFFISDGEITNDDELKSFSSLKKYLRNGAVLGYGTSQGGNMKIQNKYTNEEKYIEDKQQWPWTNAVSKIDENNLKNISKDLEIDYINMQKQSNINYKLKEIQKQQKNSNLEDKNSYIDIYYIFAIPVFLLLVYEFVYYKRKLI